MSPSSFASIADVLETDWPSIAGRSSWPRPATGRHGSFWRAVARVRRAPGPNGSGRSPRPPRVARIALVGPTAADARDTMVEGETGLLAICPNSNRPTFEPSKAPSDMAERRSGGAVFVRGAGPPSRAAAWRSVARRAGRLAQRRPRGTCCNSVCASASGPVR